MNVHSDLTRLAPSPTGALHLGNARTFLVNWLAARQRGWKILLRMDDLDGPRIKQGADRQAIDDLRWLGLDWDEGPVYQSSRADHYQGAIDALLKSGDAYPCVCSRREVELSASAPHAEDGAAVYPGTCRDRFSDVASAMERTGRAPAIRFRVRDESLDWTDALRGARRCNPARELGDFVIAKADGTPAYQLATVVDDHDAAVTQIMRGDDLIDSTPRQILLFGALGWGDNLPAFWHLPLVTGTDGRRLAKRHGDTRLAFYREAGTAPQRLLALLGRWIGVDGGEHITLAELANRFDIGTMPLNPTIFTASDDRWLRGMSS